MSYLVPINSSHIVPNGLNNTFQYPLPSVASNLKDTEICVAGITMYNSQFNINSQMYGNNTFTITIPTAATTSTISITLNDGYYKYADINRMIQTACVNAGAYLIDGDSNIYFIQLIENPTFYSAQLDLAVVPSSLGSYTRPPTGLYSSTGTGLPTTAQTPRIIISNEEFGKVIGFKQGLYPSTLSTSDVSILSNISPQFNPVSSYAIRCSLINNIFSNPSDIICNFNSAGTSIGDIISYKPNEFIWQSVSASQFSNITLQIVDQQSRSVKFDDPNILIELLFRIVKKDT